MLGHESYEADYIYFIFAGGRIHFCITYDFIQRCLAIRAFSDLGFVICFLFGLGILYFAAQPTFRLALRCYRSYAFDYDHVAGLFTNLRYDDNVA
jgi:hypothetical protein